MSGRKKYGKKAGKNVVAVQLTLETDGFTYWKWGAIQTCKPGDWLVDNGEDSYTIDGATFARTYRQVSPGQYCKVTEVWAEVAGKAGLIETKEGATHYEAGDFLVYNEPDCGDGYAMTESKFKELYERVP